MKDISARIFFNTCFLALTVFGLYVSFCEAYDYKGDYSIFIISIVSSFIMCVLWINRSIWSNLGLFTVNAGIIIVIIKNYKRIEKELGILYKYVERQYFAYMNFGDVEVNTARSHVLIFGKPVYEKLAFIVIIAILVMAIAMASLRMKCDFFVLFPVFMIIGMEMFHGKAPSLTASCFIVAGVSGLLFGIKFEMYGGRRKFFQKRHISGQIWTRYIIFAVILTLSIVVGVQAGYSTKDRVFLLSEKALQNEQKIENKVKFMAENIRRTVLKEGDGYLDNKSPDQTGKFIMRIETNKIPADNVYIRSFYANEYNGVRWSNSDKNSPLSEDDINYMVSNSIKWIFRAEISSVDIMEMKIFPEKKNSNDFEYIPYMPERLEKSAAGNYTFYCYNISNHVKNYLLSIADEELSEIHSAKNYDKYTSYVYEKYLSFPNNTKRLTKFANKIKLYQKTDLQCNAVKNAICKNTKYSRKLKALPPGKDYVEYFLLEQKKGYCEHYATAGTLLLRSKGVPARYAAGYSISPFEFNGECDASGNVKYVAYVKDYNAHAWTEVYKRGLGWLPFDMTNSTTDSDYTNSAIANSTDTKNQIRPSEAVQNSEEDTKKADKDKNTSKADKESDSTQDNANSTENTNSLDSTDKKNSSKTYEKTDGHSTTVNTAAVIFLLFLLIGFIVAIYNRIRFMLLFRKLGMANTSSERIIIYFGILNKFLSFCGIRDMSELEDAEYTRKLQSIFKDKISESQINKACDVLQCAAFSNSNIGHTSEEEVVFFIKNASHEAYKSCNKSLRFIIYVFVGRNGI